MLAGKTIPVYGDGKVRRDFTYIDDTVKGIREAMNYTGSMYEAVNLGAGHSVELMQVIKFLESLLQVKAKIEYHPSSPGDVPQTLADISKARRILGYEPAVSFEDGLRRFCTWL
jgi:UDP-glucuronate 4-epimerase